MIEDGLVISDNVYGKGAVGVDVRLQSGEALKGLVWMQYTGLKDKNGKEIFEGDIIDHPYKGIKTVFWDESLPGFGSEGTYVSRLTNGEVIGNIYENKELL